MGKIIAFCVIAIVFAFLGTYLYFTWKDKRRRWQHEDETFNNDKRKEALEEIKETYNLLEEMKVEDPWAELVKRDYTKVERK